MASSPEPTAVKDASPVFDRAFQERLADLIAWRRDVRRFRSDPIPPDLLARLLDLASLAPSVGNSQPWRFVSVADAQRRAAVGANFAACNARALAGYAGARAALYARLKLEGLSQAPVHLAVFADEATSAGAGLGRQTMPETLRYSAVLAVHTLWLAARAQGIGVGWLSILDPDAIKQSLEVPAEWRLVAYLCLGRPLEEHLDPELERHGWQSRQARCRQLIER